MKFTAAILAPLLAHEALAFVPSSPHQSLTSTALQAEKQTIATAASACLLGLGLSAQAAFATVTTIPQQDQFQYQSTSAISSSTLVAEIDKFALPSYDTSKGGLIDLSGELVNVNKQTLSNAKANREKEDLSPEEKEAKALRAAEKDGASLLDSMLGQSDLDQKDRIAAEKAESRANRWKTF